MAEWVVCPHCQLRHTQRGDDRCPRCKQAVSGSPEGPGPVPAVPHRVPRAAPARPAMPDVFDETAFARVRQEREAADAAPDLPPLVRLAGAILAANGVVHLSLWTLEAASRSTLSVVGSWTAGFDMVVGAVLLSGQNQVYRWTLVRLLFGGLTVAGLHLLDGQLFTFLLTALFCGSMLVAMRLRQPVLALAGAALALFAVGAGLLEQAPFLGNRNPIGHLTAALNGRIEWQPSARLAGRSIHFELALPAGRYYLLKPTAEEREQIEELTKPGSGRKPASELSPSARRPDTLAEVQVLAFQAPFSVSLEPDEVITSLVEEQRVRMAGLLILDDGWLDTPQGRMRILEGVTRIDGRRMGVALGVTVQGQCVLLLSGTIPQRGLPALRADMAKIYPSLRATDCEPTPPAPPPPPLTFTPAMLPSPAAPEMPPLDN